MRISITRVAAIASISAIATAGLLAAPANAAAVEDVLNSIHVKNSPGVTSGSAIQYMTFVTNGACEANTLGFGVTVTSATATNQADNAAAQAWVDVMLTDGITDADSMTRVKAGNASLNQTVNMADVRLNNDGIPFVDATLKIEGFCQDAATLERTRTFKAGLKMAANGSWQFIPHAGAATTTTVTAPAVNVNVATTLTATVSPAAAGTVQFKVDGVAVGAPVAVDPATGVATAPYTPTAGGTLAVTADFVPAVPANFAPSTGTAELVVTAPKVATASTLAVAPISGAANQAVTFSGTVAGANNTVVTGGTCDFYDLGVKLGSGPVNNGVCTYTNNSFAGPGHKFTMKYVPGTASFLASDSNEVLANYDAPAYLPDEQTIIVNVPVGNLTIFTPYTPASPLNLGDMTLDANGYQASADFKSVKVTDTRAGDLGWTASLDRKPFIHTDGTSTIPADKSGFINITPVQIAGEAITPQEVTTTDIPAGTPATGPKAFATAVPNNGLGSINMDAKFVLKDVATSTKAGLYTATVIFTIA